MNKKITVLSEYLFAPSVALFALFAVFLFTPSVLYFIDLRSKLSVLTIVLALNVLAPFFLERLIRNNPLLVYMINVVGLVAATYFVSHFIPYYFATFVYTIAFWVYSFNRIFKTDLQVSALTTLSTLLYVILYSGSGDVTAAFLVSLIVLAAVVTINLFIKKVPGRSVLIGAIGGVGFVLLSTFFV